METLFKVRMDCGQITLNDFPRFESEARRLGIRFEDRNFYFDENPEIPGVMAWLISYGGKILIQMKTPLSF